jgi:hypothetical protein
MTGISRIEAYREESRFLEALSGTVAVLTWFLLFGAGLLIDSAPYRAKISKGVFSAADVAATICFYTPLNVALLTLLAGFAGGCLSKVSYCHWSTHAAKTTPDEVSEAGIRTRRLFMTESPFASTMRSFLVYLGVIAGLYITTNGPFERPTSDQYVRFAGTISLLSFLVGYDPTRLQDLINLVPRAGSGGK